LAQVYVLIAIHLIQRDQHKVEYHDSPFSLSKDDVGF